jgi:hypothetical protein
MKNRQLFLLLVVIVIVTPAIHFFISNADNDATNLRKLLVGVQMLAGLMLLFYFGRKSASGRP